jgi:hypothetical protein
MLKTKRASTRGAAERRALRRRINQMYGAFNRELWDRCYSLIDPRLLHAKKVDKPIYAEQMKEFKEAYGAIRPWHVRVNLHLDAKTNKHDDRPFAFVYVVWQDARSEFHMFRERWVKDEAGWFTRVIGLVANSQGLANSKD